MDSHKTDMHKAMGNIMVFNQNHHFAYVYKKTEKLVTAVYMITNFIKDNEPLKWRIREKALELLSLNVSLSSVSLSDRKDFLKKYQAYSVEIVSLSSIAHHAGLISEMNFEILSREFGNLASTIEKDENKKASEETVILSPNFFDAPAVPQSLSETVRDTKSEADSVLYKRQDPIVRPTAIQHQPTAQITKDISQPVRSTKKIESKNERQEAIIKLLSNRNRLSVKDFTDTIKGVSEKTIQRELLLMVSNGVLKKEGERRWSTYSLA